MVNRDKYVERMPFLKPYSSEVGFLNVESGYALDEMEIVLRKYKELRVSEVSLNMHSLMEFRKTRLIFYFYLNHITGIIRNKKLKEQKAFRSGRETKFSLMLEKVAIAAVTTVLIYIVMMLLNLGELVWPTGYMLLELVLAFFFLLSLFWSHRKISGFINSPRVKNWRLWKTAAVEVVLVIFITLILHVLVNYIPLRLIYWEASFEPASIRASGVMAVIISLFFYFLVEREKNKKQLQQDLLRSAKLQKENYQAQLEGLRNQVNPHFLFNSFNVLGSLIHQDRERALRFNYQLSRLYRSFMKHADDQLVSLKEEMKVAESYIYLLETRFGKAVKFSINVPAEKHQLQLPPGALQLLLENAIKHNGSTKKNPLVIKISSAGTHLIVKNNLQPRLDKVQSTGTGLQNIKSRYKYLSDEKPVFTKTETKFIASLPLLKKKKL